MKYILLIVLLVALFLWAGWYFGWFDADDEIIVEDDLDDDLIVTRTPPTVIRSGSYPTRRAYVSPTVIVQPDPFGSVIAGAAFGVAAGVIADEIIEDEIIEQRQAAYVPPPVYDAPAAYVPPDPAPCVAPDNGFNQGYVGGNDGYQGGSGGDGGGGDSSYTDSGTSNNC
jgi:hypothetical protein